MNAKDIKELEVAAKNYSAPNRKWSEKDRDTVKQFYRRVPLSLLAEKLGRSPGAVSCMAHNVSCMAHNIKTEQQSQG